MVKYGRKFSSGLTDLTSTSGWAHIDYLFYKQALRTMLHAAKHGSTPSQPFPLAGFTGRAGLQADSVGALSEADSVGALDQAFRRSLLADIADVDECFCRQCALLRERLDLAAGDDARAGCRAALLELHRWSVLNYLAVLKIVKKHDKSGVLAPLRAEAVARLGRSSFVHALDQHDESFATTSGDAGDADDGGGEATTPLCRSRRGSKPSK